MAVGVNGPTVTVCAIVGQHGFDRCDIRANRRSLNPILALGCLM